MHRSLHDKQSDQPLLRAVKSFQRAGRNFQSVLGLRIARAGNIQGFFRPELLQCLSLQRPHMTTANFTTPFQKEKVLFCSSLTMSEHIQIGVELDVARSFPMFAHVIKILWCLKMSSTSIFSTSSHATVEMKIKPSLC